MYCIRYSVGIQIPMPDYEFKLKAKTEGCYQEMNSLSSNLLWFPYSKLNASYGAKIKS